ncbi:MAG: FAD-dependent oxidoreductase [Bacillota bacterium]
MNTLQSDVVVCGAGPSGLAAALGAARQGESVILIEEDPVIGGAVTDYYVQSFCGSPVHGVQQELLDYLNKNEPEFNGTNAFHRSSYIQFWLKEFAELPVTILTRNEVKRVLTRENNNEQEIVAVETDKNIIYGNVFIDSTGDADIAVQTACKTRYGREGKDEYGERFAPENRDNKVQQCSLMYIIKKIPEFDKYEAEGAKLSEDEYLIWGPTFYCQDTTDPEELRKIEMKANKALLGERKKWEKKGFTIKEIAPKIGIRESRRIVGNYLLTENDLNQGREFKDSICKAKYPIDPWDPEGNPWHEGEDVEIPFYEIPYRSLVTDKVNNLLVAGRCISGTHIANSSFRVMNIVTIIGQVSGIAAHFSNKDNCSTYRVDVEKVRKEAEAQGVVVDK